MAPGYRRPNSSMARAYCSPLKISSASFSRRATLLQTGIATDISTAMMLIVTRRAAMA
jgi:hypothetical protein